MDDENEYRICLVTGTRWGKDRDVLAEYDCGETRHYRLPHAPCKGDVQRHWHPENAAELARLRADAAPTVAGEP
jgi:hypothetical protein